MTSVAILATVEVALADPIAGLSLTWPVPTGYTSKPGQDYAQFNDGSANRHHTGLDIPASSGTAVVAAAGGTVRIFRLSDYGNKTHCLGNAVIVNHGSAATLYAHLESIVVSHGQTVTQGQQIGTVGNTLGLLQSGQSCGTTGPHLHFELKNNPVLGTTSDDGATWGYTPAPGTTGEPVAADHPDAWGFHDPVLNLHSNLTGISGSTVTVTSQGTGVTMRTGPDATYRSIGATFQAGTQYLAVAGRDTATSGCSKGWYQLVKSNGGYFADSVSGGTVPDVWGCRGNGSETWISGQTHTLTITSGPGGSPNPVASGGSVITSVSATDSLGHAIGYLWSATCPAPIGAGAFNDVNARSPTWTAPTNTTGTSVACTISVVVHDGTGGLTQFPSYSQAVSPASQPTPTPTRTASPTPSNSPSPAPTRTPTPVPTASPTPTRAPTPVPTASPTPTRTPTPVPTASPTPTRTPTPAPTASPTPTRTPTPIPSASPTPTRTPTPVPTVSPAPTLTPRPTATTSPTPRTSPSPTVFQVPADYSLDEAAQLARAGDEIRIAEGAYAIGPDTAIGSGVKIRGAARAQTVLTGQIELGRRVSLSQLSIRPEPDPNPSFLPAIRTVGNVKLVRTSIVSEGLGVYAQAPAGVINPQTYNVKRSTFVGGSGGTGIVLDLPLDRVRSRIRGNVFRRLDCGISVAIDAVFADLPPGERMAAFEAYATLLTSENTFDTVTVPVCGGRG